MAERIAAVRRFSRFYTRRIGVLQEEFLGTELTLAEGRLIYELAQRERAVARELAADLGLDPGYLSRLLKGLARRNLIERRRSAEDGRRQVIALTARGRDMFAVLNARSREEIGQILGALVPADQERLVAALAEAERLLGAAPERRAPYLLRPPQPGDIGWVVQRHGALYAQEYGWDERFEALVARIAAEFIERFDPKAERCWIAEKDGANVGSVFLVRRSKRVAKLRLLIVEPSARGLGIGQRLVAECIAFARRAGYRKIVLWTNSILHAARRIYEKAGFRLVASEPHRSFGHDLVGETWELDLAPPARRGAPARRKRR